MTEVILIVETALFTESDTEELDMLNANRHTSHTTNRLPTVRVLYSQAYIEFDSLPLGARTVLEHTSVG